MQSMIRIAACVFLALTGATAALAEHDAHDRGRDHGRSVGPREGFRGDVYGSFRGSRYQFDRGRWYRDRGTGFFIAPPPIGMMIGVLPPYYSTLWIGGIPYFYADGAYFLWRERVRRYEVVEEPRGAVARGEVSYTADDLYVYPREGQPEERQSNDRYECHRWASGQTGFDPAQPDRVTGGGTLESRRSEYRRAITACLEARGYTVR